ncbi:tyrosine-type recombinase/integrase [Pararhizobium mangrovi]|uniref:tyrosine-type recombinase/integrase n=1 Tax=Pararhizobium mangrovi TaxID=2590452 RepID=UPI0015E863EC|nr:site-specific integrase [Pararhizobium mangrovi]
MRENARKRIIERMEYSWKRLAPTFGRRVPQSIGYETVKDYTAGRRSGTIGKGAVSEGTIWTELNHLRIVLGWAEKRGRISKAPYIDMPSKPAPRDRWLTKKDVAALRLHASAPHVRLFIILAIGTGARKEALLELQWDQCDMVRGLIDLNGTRDGRTRKGRAVVPMNRTVRAALVEARKSALSGHVIEWAGEPVLSVKKGLATASRKAGMAKVTPHMFRHSAARWMAEAGSDMKRIAAYLGHSDSRTTERIYARFSPNALAAEASALELDFEDIGSNEPEAARRRT